MSKTYTDHAEPVAGAVVTFNDQGERVYRVFAGPATISTNAQVLELLLALREKAQGDVHNPFDNPWTRSGICWWVIKGSQGGLCPQLLFLPAYQTWPEYSGNPTYPVPEPLGGGGEYLFTPEGCGEAYFATLNKWEGEYGASRRRLLDHLIDYFQQA
jgi:hypothetical protein